MVIRSRLTCHARLNVHEYSSDEARNTIPEIHQIIQISARHRHTVVRITYESSWVDSYVHRSFFTILVLIVETDWYSFSDSALSRRLLASLNFDRISWLMDVASGCEFLTKPFCWFHCILSIYWPVKMYEVFLSFVIRIAIGYKNLALGLFRSTVWMEAIIWKLDH